MHDKVAHFTDEALTDDAPEHVRTVVTVGGLVECLLAEVVPVAKAVIRVRRRVRRRTGVLHSGRGDPGDARSRSGATSAEGVRRG